MLKPVAWPSTALRRNRPGEAVSPLRHYLIPRYKTSFYTMEKAPQKLV